MEGDLIMHSTWKRIYIIAAAALLIGINAVVVCTGRAFHPAEFTFTPEEKQEVDLRQLDLFDHPLLNEVQDGGYEIHHGSGTIWNMAIGEIMGGDQEGTSTITIMTSDNCWLEAYKGSQITFVGSDEDAGILREGDEISFDYVIDEYNDDKVLISAYVNRDPARLQEVFENERAQAEQEALNRNAVAKSRAVHSLAAFDIVSAAAAAILFLGICLIAKLHIRKGAKTLLAITGTVIALGLWVSLLVFPCIPAKATVVGYSASMPNAIIPLDGSADGITYEPILVEYILEYPAFGQEYRVRCIRSFDYDPHTDYTPYEYRDTVIIWLNPVFPDHVRANIWKIRGLRGSTIPAGA